MWECPQSAYCSSVQFPLGHPSIPLLCGCADTAPGLPGVLAPGPAAPLPWGRLPGAARGSLPAVPGLCREVPSPVCSLCPTGGIAAGQGASVLSSHLLSGPGTSLAASISSLLCLSPVFQTFARFYFFFLIMSSFFFPGLKGEMIV